MKQHVCKNRLMSYFATPVCSTRARRTDCKIFIWRKKCQKLELISTKFIVILTNKYNCLWIFYSEYNETLLNKWFRVWTFIKSDTLNVFIFTLSFSFYRFVSACFLPQQSYFFPSNNVHSRLGLFQGLIIITQCSFLTDRKCLSKKCRVYKLRTYIY